MKFKAAHVCCALLLACLTCPVLADVNLRDFGPKNFNYTYGGSWKKGKTVKAVQADGIGYVQIDARENGGAGIVLRHANLTPGGEKFLAVTARLVEGNEAGRLQFNLLSKKGKTQITLRLAEFDTKTFRTAYVPLPDKDFSAIENFQVQGTNFGSGAKPLRIQVDRIDVVKQAVKGKGTQGTETAKNNRPASSTSKLNQGGKTAADTAKKPAKGKPWEQAHGFYPKYPGAWLGHHRRLVKQAKKSDAEVVFLGDSITQGWTNAGKSIWEKQFSEMKPLNLGIGGDSTRQVLWRLQNGAVDGLHPKVVVLMIGTNNLYGDFNAGKDQEIVRGIEAVIVKLREKLPQSRILLCSILPRQNAYFCSRIDKINAKIGKLDNGKHIRFLDMTEAFEVSHGKVKTGLYQKDHLHLVEAGYMVWAERMRPLLEQMVVAKPVLR